MQTTNYTETHHTSWHLLSEEDRTAVLDMLSKGNRTVVVSSATSGIYEPLREVQPIYKEITVTVRIPVKKVIQ